MFDDPFKSLDLSTAIARSASFKCEISCTDLSYQFKSRARLASN